MKQMQMQNRLGVTGLILLLTLVSCATQNRGQTVSEQTLSAVAGPATPSAVVPNFVEQSLLLGRTAVQATLPQKKFNVSVQNIPAKTFFLSLVADVGVNVVTHPEVSGSISLELRNVTVTDVLNVVRDVYGYEYREKDSIYTIYPRKLRTEIFSINYIDVKRVGVTDTSVSIGEITSGGSEQGGGGGSGGAGSNSANILAMAGTEDGSSASGGQGISPGSRVQTLNTTDFWSMILATVKSMVGVPQEGRMVMVNPQAGLVVVTAMPGELNSVRNFLEQSELSVKRQVVLETQIVEVQLSKGFEAGINWNSIQGQLNYSNNVTQHVGAVDITGSTENGPEIFASIFKILDIRDLLSLLETQGNVQVLSSPRVSTVNNQKAVIRVGSDEFFVTGVKSSTTSNAAATTSSPEVELASFFSGISLDVTPQISEDGDVILHIHPIVSEVSDQLKEITVGDAKFSLPLALRDIRESDSIVRAQSGQVIVLGGLMQRSSREQNGKRPWLGDLPVLSSLFKKKNTASSKTELVILLRPIVVGPDTWDDEISKYQSQSQLLGEDYRGQ